jgi:hypothetical protein
MDCGAEPLALGWYFKKRQHVKIYYYIRLLHKHAQKMDCGAEQLALGRIKKGNT